MDIPRNVAHRRIDLSHGDAKRAHASPQQGSIQLSAIQEKQYRYAARLIADG
jgi:hypothetical protein